MADGELTLSSLPGGRKGSAVVTARLNGIAIEHDTFNLSMAKARAAFVNKICEGRPGLNKVEIGEKLLKLAVDARWNGKTGEREPACELSESTEDLLAAMPEECRCEAAELLSAPNLIDRIAADLDEIGVAGEAELALTIYLVATSRLLEQPLAAEVQGPSSSGKSHIIDRTASLIPRETVIRATQMTPQSLVHMPPGSLEHRFIVAGERSRIENDDTAEATRGLREMLSERRLSKLMPIKSDGTIMTVLIEQNGPIAFVESTTTSKICDEDANRFLLLNTDERPEQTKRIVTKLAGRYKGNAPVAERERILNRHHALQRMLEPKPIVVPFATRLAELIPYDRIQMRRAFPQLMSMIQASALLHQRQRETDAEGRLVATPDDYQLAVQLLAKPLGRLLGRGLSEPAARFLDRLRTRFDGQSFKVNDVKQHDSAGERTIRGWLTELNDVSAIDLVTESRGPLGAVWRLPNRQPELAECHILPSIEKLFS